MVNRIHVIDPDIRRRARVSRELNTYSLHAEIYEDLAEFLALAPSEGLALVSDDLDQGGQSVTEVIACADVDLPIVGFAENPSTDQVVKAMLAGAAGYLRWPFESTELVATLDRMSSEGEKRLRRERVLSKAKAKVRSLSPREKEVLTAVLGGLSNKQIGQKLSISPRTVEIHRLNMMRRLAAQSVAEAVRIGLLAGLDGDLDVPALNEAA